MKWRSEERDIEAGWIIPGREERLETGDELFYYCIIRDAMLRT